MKAMSSTVTIDAKLLARLIDRVDELTAKAQTHADVAIIDTARKLLRPRKQSNSEKWMHLSLEEMRFARDVAVQHGEVIRAFELATAIDRKRGFY